MVSPAVLFAIVVGGVTGVFLVVFLLLKTRDLIRDRLTTERAEEQKKETKKDLRARKQRNKAAATFLYYACLAFTLFAAVRLLVGPELVAPLANRSADLDNQHPDFLGKLFWALENQTIAYILFGGTSVLTVIFYLLKPSESAQEKETTSD